MHRNQVAASIIFGWRLAPEYAIRVSFQDDVICVVRQPVEGGIGHDRIREKGNPVLGWPVACDDYGRPEIALGNDFIEVFCLESSESRGTEIVNDEQIGRQILFHPFFPGLIGPTRQKDAEELHCFCKKDVIAEAAGMMANCLSDVGFPHAGGSAQKNVFVLFDKRAAAQIPDHFGVDPGIEGEVKPFKGLLFFETGAGKTHVEFFGLPAFHLILEEQLEELQVSQGVFLSLLEPQVEAFEKAAQAKRSQLFFELVIEVHGITSVLQQK